MHTVECTSLEHKPDGTAAVTEDIDNYNVLEVLLATPSIPHVVGAWHMQVLSYSYLPNDLEVVICIIFLDQSLLSAIIARIMFELPDDCIHPVRRRDTGSTGSSYQPAKFGDPNGSMRVSSPFGRVNR